jgi:hypothetical protein
MDRWPSVREGFYDRLSILSIKNKKIFTRWIDNIDENETKSIDPYHRYRSIDPSPNVPILCSLGYQEQLQGDKSQLAYRFWQFQRKIMGLFISVGLRQAKKRLNIQVESILNRLAKMTEKVWGITIQYIIKTLISCFFIYCWCFYGSKTTSSSTGWSCFIVATEGIFFTLFRSFPHKMC